MKAKADYLRSISLLLVMICLLMSEGHGQTDTCSTECGWSSTCANSTCVCLSGFVLHTDGKNCRNASCTDVECLQCLQPNTCKKCANFLSATSGLCLKVCVGSSQMLEDNLICSEKSDDGTKVNLVIAVVAGVGAGVIICIVVIIIACVCVRRSRKNINLLKKSYTVRQMDNGHIKQFPTYENSAFESETTTYGKIDPLEYIGELDRLRPHTDALMAMLSQVRGKTRAMDSTDTRVPTYKGVIHQLCRVLALLHKKDPVVSIPSDAMALVQWAHQMLEDNREQESAFNPELCGDYLPSVDLVLDTDTPIYTIPDASLPGTSVDAHYTTLPTSRTKDKQTYYSLGRKSGYATINRASSVTNAALIRALESDHCDTLTYPSHPDPEVVTREPDDYPITTYQPKHEVTHRTSSVLSREDLQNFLISSSRQKSNKSTQGVRSGYDFTDMTSPQISSPALQNSPQISSPALHNSPQISNPTLKHVHSPQISNPTLENVNRFREAESTYPVKTSKKPPIPPKPSSLQQDNSVVSYPSIKKNIITNPNAIKKSNSLSKYAVPNIGYFANGHYYDPNPMPRTDSEVYAPGSNYSDRSIVMSTFLGDQPPSESCSDQSEDGDDDSDFSGGDLDVFPFDLRDATEPVEV
ncbi:uncharacterized protein LOC131949820 [Physella acuta]|uniref:uncharacterized protein LOC131949820 n=1 Tax=Physella acuta TaxID=109671 RepID=UPI0027DC8C1E|nr:uncharacterized protein LOC131949820 [Physella acuta]XP_059167795.1 uncharacterized protein LOC131949820 [Physella acuta]